MKTRNYNHYDSIEEYLEKDNKPIIGIIGEIKKTTLAEYLSKYNLDVIDKNEKEIKLDQSIIDDTSKQEKNQQKIRIKELYSGRRKM